MRIIIIGAGPAGLIFAHCLTRAGIDDFIILERRREVVEELGSGILLWPHTIRIFDQLGNGLLDAARKMEPSLLETVRLDAKGKLITRGSFWHRLKENHGHPAMVFQRYQLIQLLYEKLPGREKVLCNKRIKAINESSSEVEVVCSDGCSYKCDILVGADGVHSMVRQLLGTCERSPIPDPLNLPEGVRTTFRAVCGISPLIPGLPPRTQIDIMQKDTIWQLLQSGDWVGWCFYRRLPQTTTKTSRFNDEDADEFVSQFQHQIMAEGSSVTFGDLWRSRKRAQVVDIEEGVLKEWHKGRVVLLGDATHKMSPNLGLGGNAAVESAVTLSNLLFSHVQNNGQSDMASIEPIFSEYQKRRMKRTQDCTHISGNILSFAWLAVYAIRFLCIFIPVEAVDRLLADWVLNWVSRDGEILKFAQECQHQSGRIAWRYPNTDETQRVFLTKTR
ncbi:hypothetical protein QQS21_005859 [Conoideocrella luteorostrata]|uniref:FAD-binding domain-containing protein n=1 Tax=Conoideocrella luteorostrata TaxID=1105319 RepID=A0AAJ0CNN9_9HYPO|nr:hypothetical protein QQS21_005859 [Conoideocrella luteorostrata]